MKIGITATREGLTDKQRRFLTSQLRAADTYHNQPLEFHHGGCVGGDEQGAMIAGNLGYTLVDHPAVGLDHLRTRLVSHVTLEPAPPLDRNDSIIEVVDRLYACPKEDVEPKPARGQGTWSTIRHARTANRRTIIIWPNGMMEITCEGEMKTNKEDT